MAHSSNSTSAALNLFVAHSPFQRFIADHIVRRMPEFRDSNNYLIVDGSTQEAEVDRTGWREVTICDPPVGASVVGAGPRMRTVIQWAVYLCRQFRATRLFLTNVQWPLNNVLRATLRNETSWFLVEVCNYPEGIGSLGLVYPDWRQKMRDTAKSVLGVLTGVPYQPLREDLMGLERSDRIYSLMPHLLPEHLQAKAITIPPVPISSYAGDSRTCVFLGQNDRLVPKRYRRPLAEAAASYCRLLPYTRFLFKSHHYGESQDQRNVFVGAGFEPLANSRPIEQLLATDPAACVVSFNSSALVHLKMMYGDRIRCVACFPDRFGKLAGQRTDRADSVSSLFARCGVEIWERDPREQ
ncbi:MAG: hypothetical protein AB1772_12970 [Candidatus Zixiibacteriota bacterium]